METFIIPECRQLAVEWVKINRSIHFVGVTHQSSIVMEKEYFEKGFTG